MPTLVEIPRSVYDLITQWAESAYPHEGCGLLVGRFDKDGAKRVVRLAPLENKLLKTAFADAAANDPRTKEAMAARLSTLPTERLGRPEVGFAFDPTEFNRETLAAEKEGLDVVGVIHTHPDHPPRPSKIDESQPFLAFWSNVIVSVRNGKTADMKSWFRETDDRPFDEEQLKIS